MYTPPDGTSPIMQMYLWGPGAYRAMNGGDDASILYHEYTHGLSDRLIHDAGGAGALNSAQSGAMGEGWSDWYAKDFLVDEFPALDNPAVNGDVHMGVYTDATPNTIRHQGLDCPVGGAGGRPARAAATRTATSARSRASPRCTPTARSGPRRCGTCARRSAPPNAERLITQGMRLSPPEPSFLDVRNAILPPTARPAARSRTQIWTVFAARGMGYYASTTGADDVAAGRGLLAAAGSRRRRAGRSPGAMTDGTGAPLADATVALGSLVAEADAERALHAATCPRARTRTSSSALPATTA